MRLPDFLIIGAARCGTTTLHEVLRSHPGVFLPPNKRPEPHFFLRDADYQKGLDHYSNKYFAGVESGVTAGESSTSYIYSEKACGRIGHHLPDIRLLSILRAPAERAFSHFRWNIRHGLEPLGFSDALKAEEHRLKHPRTPFEEESSPFSYMDRGRYFQQLSRYLSVFGEKRVCAILLDDLIEDPDSTARKVTEFLNISFQVDCTIALSRRNQNAADGATLSDQDRSYIIERVRTDVERLQQWLSRDLSHWTTP